MDEKKIEEAAEDIFEDKFLGNGEEIIFTNDEGCEDYREEMYHDGQIKEAISLGAHWAIQEFLKGLWHPASEEPRNDYSDILVIRKLHRPTTISPQLMLEDIENDNTSYKDEWNKVCDELQIKKYFYIDDLLPKQKGGSDD